MDADRELAELLAREGIKDKCVIEALAKVSRLEFVDEKMSAFAYQDRALPIKCGQTISQPFIVARMTELLLHGRTRLSRVLEVGTGSGYQAAVLAGLADEVYSIERIEALYLSVKERFARLGYNNIQVTFADGNQGLAEHAPYEGIIVTAAAEAVPPALLEQLSPKQGILVIPVSVDYDCQQLQRITRDDDQYSRELFDLVTFVPLKKGKE